MTLIKRITNFVKVHYCYPEVNCGAFFLPVYILDLNLPKVLTVTPHFFLFLKCVQLKEIESINDCLTLVLKIICYVAIICAEWKFVIYQVFSVTSTSKGCDISCKLVQQKIPPNVALLY